MVRNAISTPSEREDRVKATGNRVGRRNRHGSCRENSPPPLVSWAARRKHIFRAQWYVNKEIAKAQHLSSHQAIQIVDNDLVKMGYGNNVELDAGCSGGLSWKMFHSFCCYRRLPRVSFSFRLRFEWSLWNLEACRVWWLPLWFLSPSSRATVKVMKSILWAMKQKRQIEMKSGRILEKFSCCHFSLCRYGEKFLAKNKIKFCHVFSLVSLPFVVWYLGIQLKCRAMLFV